MSFADLPKFDELKDPKRFWSAEKGSRDEGLAMLRYLTPAHEISDSSTCGTSSQVRSPDRGASMRELGNDKTGNAW